MEHKKMNFNRYALLLLVYTTPLCTMEDKKKISKRRGMLRAFLK